MEKLIKDIYVLYENIHNSIYMLNCKINNLFILFNSSDFLFLRGLWRRGFHNCLSFAV